MNEQQQQQPAQQGLTDDQADVLARARATWPDPYVVQLAGTDSGDPCVHVKVLDQDPRPLVGAGVPGQLRLVALLEVDPAGNVEVLHCAGATGSHTWRQCQCVGVPDDQAWRLRPSLLAGDLQGLHTALVGAHDTMLGTYDPQVVRDVREYLARLASTAALVASGDERLQRTYVRSVANGIGGPSTMLGMAMRQHLDAGAGLGSLGTDGQVDYMRLLVQQLGAQVADLHLPGLEHARAVALADWCVAQARQAGTDAGAAAATWATDGNTSVAQAQLLAQLLADGDPRVEQYLRAPGLAGEHAGDPTPASLLEQATGWDYDDLVHLCEQQVLRVDADALLQEMCEAYEDAADGAYWPAAERQVRQLAEPPALVPADAAQAFRQGQPGDLVGGDA